MAESESRVTFAPTISLLFDGNVGVRPQAPDYAGGRVLLTPAFDLSFNASRFSLLIHGEAQGYLGADNQDALDPLQLPQQIDLFLMRGPFNSGNAGVSEASLKFALVDPQSKKYGFYVTPSLFTAAELRGFPAYFHNNAWGHKTLEGADWDASAPKDAIPFKFSPSVTTWGLVPLALIDFQLGLQYGNAGENIFDSQINYINPFVSLTLDQSGSGGLAPWISLAAYYIKTDPAQLKNDFGDEIQSTQGWGLALITELAKTFRFNVSYSRNWAAEEGDITTSFFNEGVNASAAVHFPLGKSFFGA